MITKKTKDDIIKGSTIATAIGIYVSAPFVKGIIDGKNISQDYQTIDSIVKAISISEATLTTAGVATVLASAPLLMKDNNKNITEEAIKLAGAGTIVGIVANTIVIGTAYGLGYMIGKYS